MAVISLDLSSAATCPRATPCSLAQALTTCSGPRPCAASWDRRSVLPSMATRRVGPPSSAAIALATQSRNPSRPAASWPQLGRSRSAARPPAGGARVGLLFVAGVFVLGGLTLLEHVYGLDLGIDELLFHDDPTAPGVVLRGRMSPVTAADFCLVGASLVLLHRDSERSQRQALWCAVPVMMTAIQAAIGYAYGVPALYQVKPFSALALNTALAFWVLSASIMAAVPGQGFMKIITSETAGGLVARRLLPLILAGLFVLGRLRLAGEEAGWYDGRFGLALMVLMSMTFCAGIVLWHAGVLYRVDLRRGRAEAEVAALNAELERKVKVRTQELQRALDEVKQLGGLLPICAWCKKIRDDQNYWQSVEVFIAARTDATFTHGVCPGCLDAAMKDVPTAGDAGGEPGAARDPQRFNAADG